MEEKDFNFKTGWPRVLLLFIALLISNLWIEIHINEAWWVQRIINFVSALLAVFAFLSGFMNSAEEDSWKGILRKIVLWFLGGKQLAIVYGIEVIIILFVSSISIVPDEIISVSIASSGSVHKGGVYEIEKEKKTVFTKLIMPWGRVFNVAADGRRSQDVTVYPWFSTKCDLEPEASIFVGFMGSHNLYDKLVYTITINGQTEEVKGYGKTSLLIGKKIDLTNDWPQVKTQFLADYPGTEEIFPQVQTEWSSPSRYNPKSPLNPGDTLIITVTHDQPRAIKSVTLRLDKEDQNLYLTFVSP